jgi:hypothetical protein
LRDFYFRLADETAVDAVYVGEAICSKRAVLFDFVAIVERLKAAGKTVVLSTLGRFTFSPIPSHLRESRRSFVPCSIGG